jgi:hypothetical protein
MIVLVLILFGKSISLILEVLYNSKSFAFKRNEIFSLLILFISCPGNYTASNKHSSLVTLSYAEEISTVVFWVRVCLYECVYEVSFRACVILWLIRPSYLNCAM